MYAGKVLPCLIGRPHIGLADYLHQRDPGAIYVYEAVPASMGALVRDGGPGRCWTGVDSVPDVLELCHVLFQMDPGYSNPAAWLRPGPSRVAVRVYIQVARGGDGSVVLGDLVALHEVGVRVVLPVKLRVRGDGAAQRQACHDGVLYRRSVDHRQHPGHTETDGAHQAVGLGVLVVGAAGAEHLAFGEELDVDLEPDYRFVFHPSPPVAAVCSTLLTLCVQTCVTRLNFSIAAGVGCDNENVLKVPRSSRARLPSLRAGRTGRGPAFSPCVPRRS